MSFPLPEYVNLRACKLQRPCPFENTSRRVTVRTASMSTAWYWSAIGEKGTIAGSRDWFAAICLPMRNSGVLWHC